MTNTNEEVERIVTAFDAHLSQSAPSMDKFEKASALNLLRTSLTNFADKVRGKDRKQLLKDFNYKFFYSGGEPAEGSLRLTHNNVRDFLASLTKIQRKYDDRKRSNIVTWLLPKNHHRKSY